MSITSFQVGAMYSFNTVAPAIIGSTYKNLTLIGQTTYDIASVMDQIEIKHRQIFPLLPSGTPDNYTLYDYLVFKDSVNNKYVFGIPWIDSNTIIQSNAGTLTLTLPNANNRDIKNLSDIMNLGGYKNYTIDLK